MLFYDERDRAAARHGDRRLAWLFELGARTIAEAPPNSEGFLFAGARSIADYQALVSRHPLMRDKAEERLPLLTLDGVLDALAAARIDLPAPKTWRFGIDDPVPPDITFPLFVRTASTSWKRGGTVSKVRNAAELAAEAEALRHAIQWDALILAREWLDLAPAGAGVYGKIPVEVRVWIVDGAPFAWSFHHLAVVAAPSGFPPTSRDLVTLADLGRRVGRAFRSRLVCADFAKQKRGGWIFIEAGPGSAAGTAHEAVFKAVASRLTGVSSKPFKDDVAGLF